MRIVCIAALLAACGEDPAPPARVQPEPQVVAPVEPAPIEAPREEPAPIVAPQPVEAGSIERAIEPVEGAARAIDTAVRGTTSYVLFRWDGEAVARDALDDAAAATIEAALEACDEVDDYGMYDCAVGAAPDPYLAASLLCDARAWGVAIVTGRNPSYVRTHRRFLFAMSCEDDAPTETAPSIRARDVDGDGEEELIVTMPIARTVRSDNGMNGSDSGVVVYVLDRDDLRTQVRVTSHYESMTMDVGGTTTSCRGAWRLTDVNHDAHDDISVNARCTEDYQDDESGDSSRRRNASERDCLYDVASDAWPCGEPIAAWLFSGGGASDSVLGETPEDAARSMGPGLGATLRARPAEEPVEAEAPPAARTCVMVVDDPAPPLRVRAQPSSRSEPVGELANGTELVLLERAGRWARIDRPAAGWVFTENLRERCAP